MTEENKAAANPNPAENAETKETPDLINNAEKTDVIEQASEQQRQAQEAEEKRLLEADEITLSEVDKGKRETLIKAREEKKLLETPDDQLDDAKKAEKAELKKAQENKEANVPEKYEFNVPEGMTLDQGLVDKLSPVLKENKITQEGAQKIADVYIEHQKTLAADAAKAFEKFKTDSHEETIKALGAGHKEQLSFVAKARDKFFSEETLELFKAAGISSNKALIFDMIKIGKTISENKVPGGPPNAPGTGQSAAQVMYGSK